MEINGPDWWWALELELRRQFEEQPQNEEGLLRADPAYIEWLDKLEQDSKHDERK